MGTDDVIRLERIRTALDTERSWRAAVEEAKDCLPHEVIGNISSAVEVALRVARTYDAPRILAALYAAGNVEAGIAALEDDTA